jgi:hypothetical protein
VTKRFTTALAALVGALAVFCTSAGPANAGWDFSAPPSTGWEYQAAPAPKPGSVPAGSAIFDNDGSVEVLSGALPPAEIEALQLTKVSPTKYVRKTSLTASTLEAFVPAPYSTLRWKDSANGHPNICVNNNTSLSHQPGFDAWYTNADDYYGIYSATCTGYYDNERIDIEEGWDSTKGCAYVWKDWDSNGVITATNVYDNIARYGDCYNVSTVSAEHWKSQALLLGMGNLTYYSSQLCPGTKCPNTGYNQVMDLSRASNLQSFASRGDGLSYSYYN